MLKRRIFIALLESATPMTSREIAEALDLSVTQVRDQVCRMTGPGGPVRAVEAGSGRERYAYEARHLMLPADEEAIATLVKTYGARAVRAAVKRSEP